jgi:hypothetical protein
MWRQRGSFAEFANAFVIGSVGTPANPIDRHC